MVVFGYAVRLKIERIFVFVLRESDKESEAYTVSHLTAQSSRNN